MAENGREKAEKRQRKGRGKAAKGESELCVELAHAELDPM